MELGLPLKNMSRPNNSSRRHKIMLDLIMISRNNQALRRRFCQIYSGKDMNNISQKIQRMIDGISSKKKRLLTKMIYCLELMKRKKRRNLLLIFPTRKINHKSRRQVNQKDLVSLMMMRISLALDINNSRRRVHSLNQAATSSEAIFMI
jgi:hypothetical protein